MHVAAPRIAEDVPGEQGEHIEAPILSEYNPGKQGEHIEAPVDMPVGSGEKVPIWQELHVSSSTRYWPDRHRVQSERKALCL